MATALEIPAKAPTDDEGLNRHTRCCKPAVKHGLCGNGKPMTEVPIVSHKFDCADCERIFIGEGHHKTCPRDSGFWP